MVWVDLYQREGIFRPKNKINDCLKTFFHLNIFAIIRPIHTQVYQRDSQKGREDKEFFESWCQYGSFLHVRRTSLLG